MYIMCRCSSSEDTELSRHQRSPLSLICTADRFPPSAELGAIKHKWPVFAGTGETIDGVPSRPFGPFWQVSQDIDTSFELWRCSKTWKSLLHEALLGYQWWLYETIRLSIAWKIEDRNISCRTWLLMNQKKRKLHDHAITSYPRSILITTIGNFVFNFQAIVRVVSFLNNLRSKTLTILVLKLNSADRFQLKPADIQSLSRRRTSSVSCRKRSRKNLGTSRPQLCHVQLMNSHAYSRSFFLLRTLSFYQYCKVFLPTETFSSSLLCSSIFFFTPSFRNRLSKQLRSHTDQWHCRAECQCQTILPHQSS